MLIFDEKKNKFYHEVHSAKYVFFIHSSLKTRNGFWTNWSLIVMFKKYLWFFFESYSCKIHYINCQFWHKVNALWPCRLFFCELHFQTSVMDDVLCRKTAWNFRLIWIFLDFLVNFAIVSCLNEWDHFSVIRINIVGFIGSTSAPIFGWGQLVFVRRVRVTFRRTKETQYHRQKYETKEQSEYDDQQENLPK